MRTQTKKWLSKFLAFLMLVVTLCTDTGVMVKAAASNEITEVAIKNIPEGGVLRLEDGRYNFDPDFKKENAKRKTTGLVYWEVNVAVDTAGVQSSRWGYVYPAAAGEFEIRAVAFRNKSELNEWLKARKANGYVEDPAAGEKYVTAYSDWERITVVSDTEGLGVAHNQYQLNLLLKNKDIRQIKVQTDAADTFKIGKKSYLTKNLVVDAPNLEVDNYGRFASIEIEQIRESTFHEFAWGNRFTVKAPNTRLVVEKGATVKSITFVPEQKNAADVLKLNIDLFGTLQMVNVAPTVIPADSAAFVRPVVTINRADVNARLDDVVVSSTSEVKITGEGEKEIPVTVEESAPETKLDAEVPVKVELNANTNVTLGKEAAKSEIAVAGVGVAASIAGEAEDVVVKIGKSAEGAVVKAETKVEVQVEAASKVEVGEGAEGTAVVVMGKDVKVEVKNNTKEEVVVKDTLGNVVGQVVGGEKDEIVVTPTAVPTSVPSSGGSGSSGSSSGGNTVTPGTPEIAGTPGAISFKEVGEDGTPISAKVTVSGTNPAEYTGEISVFYDVKTVLISVEASTGYAAITDQPIEIKDDMVTFEITGLEGYKNLIVTLTVGYFSRERWYSIPFNKVEVVSGAAITVSGTAIDVEKAIEVTGYEAEARVVRFNKEFVAGTNIQVTGEIKVTFTAEVWSGNYEYSKNIIFEWRKYGDIGYEVIPDATSSTCTVTISLSELLEDEFGIIIEVSGTSRSNSQDTSPTTIQ